MPKFLGYGLSWTGLVRPRTSLGVDLEGIDKPPPWEELTAAPRFLGQ